MRKVYKFDDIVVNSTTKKKPEDSDKTHYIGLEHIEPGVFEFSRWGADVTPKGDKLIMKKGDLLFGKRRAYQRKVAIAPFDGIFSAHGMVLRPKEDVVCREYFPFFISSNQFMDTAMRISVGGLSPTINWKDLQKQEFELPSIAEQRVLADKLWAAYNLKESYKKMIIATDEMVKAQFVEMFGSINKTKLIDFVNIIRGVSYKPHDIRDVLTEDSKAILRSNNIDNGNLNFFELVFVDQSRVSQEQQIKKGDIVICASNGSRSLVGKAAMSLEDKPNYAHGAFCLLVRPLHNILPEYLCAFMQTDLYKIQINALASGSNILNIKPDHLYNLDIPIPEIDLQMKFVKITQQAEKSKQELTKAIEKIDRVIKSLLQ